MKLAAPLLAGLLGLVVAAAVFARHDSVGAAEAANGTITVSATLVSYTEIAQGRAGHLSDANEEAWLLRDRNGRRIGRMYLACRWVAQTSRFCAGAVVLPLGQLTLAGVSPSAFGGHYAVTGGTARYMGAGGEATLTTTGLARMIVSIVLT